MTAKDDNIAIDVYLDDMIKGYPLTSIDKLAVEKFINGAFQISIGGVKGKNIALDAVYLYTPKGQSGIGDIEIEDEKSAPVEYYNLQGIRVYNPEHGIYIRRQGNKVSKVML